ncbi:MAG: DUF3999 domain-containing protein [Dokdonella sp.]|uniref:DUF3999 domain-containing protein n=1 Tax=Dokdonella sp. TaxID=2291710 RepID=UPI003F8021AD
MKRVLAASLALGCACASAADLRDYAYAFTIETPAGVESSAWRVDLDPSVYAWLRDPALRDVAIFNAEGEPVPCARVAAETLASVHERTESLPLLALPAGSAATGGDLRLLIERDAHGRLRRLDAGDGATTKSSERAWVVDASDVDGAMERLILAWDTPASGVVARFDVAAGDDLEHWRHVGDGSVLSLREGDAHLDRNDIALPGVRAKYLRLNRLDDGDALVGLAASARVVQHTAATPVRRWIDAHPDGRAADADGTAAASFAYTLPAALPVEQARIELASDNALAALALSGRDGSAWTELARLTAFRVRSGDDALRNGDVDLAGARRYGAFRLDARTPLATPPRLAFAFRPDRFVFLAEGAGPYRLAVGSATARRPDYPLDAALASLRESHGRDWQPPQATIGAGHASGGDAALQPPPAPRPWRQWLLWTVLALGAALVGGFAVSLLRERKP